MKFKPISKKDEEKKKKQIINFQIQLNYLTIIWSKMNELIFILTVQRNKLN